ncbi:MAG: DegT/DnrJ/EryC1/StrS family aminotransferase [Gemmatimonadota bacterium]
MWFRAQLPAHSPLSLAALRSGAASFLSGGKRAEGRVRERLTALLGPRRLLLTDSGTSALCMALDAIRHRRPGPVALPAYSCYDVATAAVGADVPVVLYDLDPHTLGPDGDSLRWTVRQGAVAVVLAPLYGLPVRFEEVRAIASDEGAILLEDAAQGAGATYREKPLGTLGSLGVLSFGRGKGTTGGGGGALLANDAAGEELIYGTARESSGRRGARELVVAGAQWSMGRPALFGLPRRVPGLRLGETVYRAPRPPGPLTAAAAGILLRTLELAPEEERRRRENAARLLELLSERPGLRTYSPPEGSRSGYLRLPVLLDGAGSTTARGSAASRLGVRPGYPAPLYGIPQLASRCRNASARFPGADRLARGLFTLPTHGLLRERDLRALEAWIRTLR